MELLETDDPIKGKLLKKSAMHREQLEEEVKLISDRTQKIITNAVIVGGALAVTYVLISQFTGSKTKKKSKAAKIKLIHSDQTQSQAAAVQVEPEAPGVVAQIGTALASQAMVFLLSIAKEKLMEYLQAQHQPAVKHEGNEHS